MPQVAPRARETRTTLYVFAGLPGTGKTTLARHLARVAGAVHLRIDSIEQALRDAGSTVAGPEGYVVAGAVAADNLRLGWSVVADSVNPLRLTRDAWREVAGSCGAACVEIEVICSDLAEHRKRVEGRSTDLRGLRLPTWQEVTGREYEPWDRPHVVIDTAGRSIDQSCAELDRALLPRAEPAAER